MGTKSVSVGDAFYVAEGDDAVFVDVREAIEREAGGRIPGSVHAPPGFLEFHADPESPMHLPERVGGNRLILYCASGGRPPLAAKASTDVGIENVCNLTGDFAAWKEAGGTVEREEPRLRSPYLAERLARQARVGADQMDKAPGRALVNVLVTG